jgi:hypothetical protein
MHDADLQLIDADPRDPFDFYPARYNAQLVAGYSKNTPAKGLKTYMPDYDDLRSTAPSAVRPRRIRKALYPSHFSFFFRPPPSLQLVR